MYIKSIFTGLLLSSVSTSALAQNSLRPNIIRVVQAESTTNFDGYLRKDSKNLSHVSSGDWFSIETGNLGAGVDSVSMRYAKGDWLNANLEVRLGSLDGPILASGPLSGTGSWDRYRNVTYKMDNINGENELFFVFSGDGAVGNIDNIRFGQTQQNFLQAERATISSGITKEPTGVASIDDGEWVRFNNTLIGDGFSQFTLRYIKSDNEPNHVTLHLDSLDGPKIGEANLTVSEGNYKNRIVTAPLEHVEGKHDIYAKFSGPGKVDMLDFVRLKSQPLSTSLKVADADIVRGMSYFDNEKFLSMFKTWHNWFRFNWTSVSYNSKVELTYARGSDLPMSLEIRKWGRNGTVLATVDLPNTGSYDQYETISTHLKEGSTGIYHLAFKLVGEGGVNIGDIDLVRIEDSESLPLGEVTLDNIAIDQFGYKPEMDKVAIIRDGQTGEGSTASDYIPGGLVALVDATTNEIVYTAAPTEHMNGAIDPLSGDRAWWFDFSEIQTSGEYYIYDAANNARSATFEINENIYDNILREAFRTFLYQRSGFEKTAELAGEDYADGASHTGPLQDTGARLFDDQRNASTSRDLSGGWYDAGDFHKYSNWTADYILGLLDAYHANPDAWGDDWDMPDSGNGIPDILDEVRWGVEHLQRMQETSDETTAANVGAVLSVLNSDDSVSPASENEENSFYGSVSTSATYTSAAAFAFAASTFEDIPNQGFQDLADSLETSAVSAYAWAESNPNVRFNNTENGVGNGNSEVSDDYSLEAKHRVAAIYLYGLTGDTAYQTFVETDYTASNFMTNLWASPYEVEEPTALLHYSSLEGINPAISTDIQDQFNDIMELAGNARPALADDPYRSYIQEYTWGSNKQKSRKGNMFTQLVTHDIGERDDQENLNVAAGYLHYLHGVNPLGKVYLTNMNGLGAERSVDEMYHRWFIDGSPWDNVNTSFGPPPGFLVGGPNQYYSEGDGSLEVDQPPAKSYVETNSFLDNEQSWQFTENSNGYQIEYLKLLSQFVR